jgi:putative copper resistance protein D
MLELIDPLILTRSVHLTATVLACGTTCFMGLIDGPAASTGRAPAADYLALRRRLTWMVWIALAVAILSGIVWLVWLSAEIYGAPIVAVCLHGGVWSMLTDTRFGLVCTIRLGLALVLAALLPWPAMRLLQITAGAGLIALIALTGHAGATPGTAGGIHLASDMVHLLAAGAWVGGLPALTLLLACARRADDPAWRGLTAGAVRRFSWLGVAAGTRRAARAATQQPSRNWPRALRAAVRRRTRDPVAERPCPQHERGGPARRGFRPYPYQ